MPVGSFAQSGCGPAAILRLQEFFDKRAPCCIGNAEAGELGARLIEAHDATRRVEHRYQSGNGVERGRHEATLHGECALGALARALRLFLSPHPVVEFEPGDDLAPQHFKQRDVLAAELARLARQHSERAHKFAVAHEERNARVRAARLSARHVDAAGQKARIFGGVFDQQRLSGNADPLAGSLRANLLGGVETEARFEPQAVEVEPADIGEVSRTQHRGKFRQLVESRVLAAVEHVEF